LRNQFRTKIMEQIYIGISTTFAHIGQGQKNLGGKW
jgi:hypothetical protein